MKRGFLLGKFMPPHLGHVYCCDFARPMAGEVTVLVCSLDDDPIPGALRYDWMSRLAPRCRVRHLTEPVPQEPSEHPRFWEIWREIVRRFHPEPIDYVFASEAYGQRLAGEVGARFVPVDPGRQAVPVSAADIRRDPFRHWRFIPDLVRPYFARRICLFGPESTGKSTLAGRLARHFDTVWVPEYGRIHTDAFGTDCAPEDLLAIARGHVASEAAAARNANRILILDGDPILTAVWADMLGGGRDPWFAEFRDTADLYLLTDIDAPWVDDGTRYFPAEADRQRFLAACRAELEARGLPFVTLSGGPDARFRIAVDAIAGRFPGLDPEPRLSGERHPRA